MLNGYTSFDLKSYFPCGPKILQLYLLFKVGESKDFWERFEERKFLDDPSAWCNMVSL